MDEWLTPTPWPDPISTPAIDLDPQETIVDIADYGVGMWQTANRDGFLDLMLVLLLLLVILLALRNIHKRLQDL
jgi:hypothetical protein